MSAAEDAREALARGQELLDRVQADIDRIPEVLEWLVAANEHAQDLAAYYLGQAQTDVDAVLADEPEAVTPPIGDQDSAWEALADIDDAMLRVLRLATAHVTAGLDDDDALDETDADS